MIKKNISLKKFYSNFNFCRLEPGIKSIFVPHSQGVYISITLNGIDENTLSNNFESNYEQNKFFKCNAILNLDSFDQEIRDLLM